VISATNFGSTQCTRERTSGEPKRVLRGGGTLRGEVLRATGSRIGSDAFSEQYQQMPVPPGGAMIKRHWIKRYKELPPHRERSLILQSWDTASKGGPENDFSVCTTWFISRDRRWYLIDVWRKRVDYPGLKAAVRNLATRYAAKRVLVEDAGAGTAFVALIGFLASASDI
jgi:phage terminase large subunit-like protein